MAVFREGYHTVERIQKQSKQLFSDSCDYGVPVQKGDSLWREVKSTIHMYGVEGTRKVSKYETGLTLSQNIELMREWSDGKVETFEIEYIESNGLSGMDGYFTVNKIK